MRGPQRSTGGWKLGTICFLLVALLLAIFSGDVLLVLAVASAIGGLLLLTGRRASHPVTRQAAIPLQAPQATPVAAPTVRVRTSARRMAVRRYRGPSPAVRRAAPSGGSAHSSVAEPASQTQVVQVFQQS